MTLTLDDVRNKRFRMARKSGYEVLEVDEFVDEVEESFAQLVEENQNLKKQVEALAHWFDVSNDRQEGRRERLAESKPFVPGFLWAALILISVVVLGYQLLMLDPTVRVAGQAYSMAAMALTVFAALAVVYMVDRPFNDRGAAIPHTRMSTALGVMERTAPATLPCDGAGNPS